MLKKKVFFGQEMPKFYGIAYYNHAACYAICYPIPINILVRFWREKIWLRIKYGFFKSGFDKAYRQGYEDGWHAGVKNVMTNLDQIVKNLLEERNASKIP